MTPEQLLEASVQAGREGRMEDARALMGVYESVSAVGVQPLPQEVVEATDARKEPTEVDELERLAASKALVGRATRTPEQQAALEELVRLEAREKAGALVSPGGRVDIPGDPTIAARAVGAAGGLAQAAYDKAFPVKYEEVYRPGSTSGVLPSQEPGETREDYIKRMGALPAGGMERWETPGRQSVEEVFTRQPLMTAAALAKAQKKAASEGDDDNWVDYLPDALRISLQGVETPLGAGIRVGADTFAGAAEVAARQALGYEVDPVTGEPLYPDDLSYRAEQYLREGLGDEDYPTTLATGGVLGLGPLGQSIEANTGFDLGEAPRNALVDLGVPEVLAGFITEGWTVPTFGPVDTGSEAAQEMDPYGLRVYDADMDWNDQIVRNATVSRTMKDLFVDMPEVREAYAEKYGSESAAFWGGALADMLVPDVTMLAGPAIKGTRAAGEFADAGLTYIAARRVVGKDIVNDALVATKAVRGEDMAAAVGEAVAREAVGPRALIDAVDEFAVLGTYTVPDIVRIAEEAAPGSVSALWVAERSKEVGLGPAFKEMRIAQGAADVGRVFEATLAGAKKTDDGLAMARTAATKVARALGKGDLPESMAAAISTAQTPKGLRKAIGEVVPPEAAMLDIGRAGTGPAIRTLLNKADEPIVRGFKESAEAFARRQAVARDQVAEMTRKALGEMVPRDMVAVTSRVMIPRRVADAMRKAVNEDLKGTIVQVEGGFRVAGDKIKPTLAAIERQFPPSLRSDFWDDLSDAVRKGEDLNPDQVSRLSQALQSDAYLRLARDPKTGRALAEGLANIGKELDAATQPALQSRWARNRAVAGFNAFFGDAKGAPAAYSEMGRLIGKETFGIPKRVADALKASRKAGDPDPFLKVGEDLAEAAGEFSDNFIYEAWVGLLTPLYAGLAQTAKANARVKVLMQTVPSMESLREVDEILLGLGSESFKKGIPSVLPARKDFGAALADGLFEAEGWVTIRKTAGKFIEDNPGLDLSMTPGLRGLGPDEAKKVAAQALADIMQQGTTYPIAPGMVDFLKLAKETGYRGLGAKSAEIERLFEYQNTLNSVGSALRAFGVKYLDEGISGRIANRAPGNVDGWLQIPDEINALLMIPQGDLVLRKVQEVDSMLKLAENADILKRVKTPTDQSTLLSSFGTLNDFARAGADLIAANEPTRLVKSLFGPAIAVLAKQGVSRALETSFGVVTSPIRRVGKTLDDVLFEASGRPWTQRQINAEVSRLGIGSSTRLSAARRGRLVKDLMADLRVTMESNKALGGIQTGAQIATGLARMLPSMVDKVEQAFRREVFGIALREGRTPEKAAEIARDAVLDFEPVGTGRAARLLQPFITGGVTSVAGLESMLARPQETARILRGMRAKQDYVQRTYGTDEELTGFELPLGAGRINMYGPSAAGYMAGLAADTYYKGISAETAGDAALSLADGSGLASAAGVVSGGISTWIEGEPTDLTRDDEIMQVMLMASLADRSLTNSPLLGPTSPWDLMVDRYGLTATNFDKEGATKPIKIGSPARKGAAPQRDREIDAYYTYKMSKEGRDQFKKDMAWARLMQERGAIDLTLEAYKMYAQQPELGMATTGLTELETAESQMDAEVRKATGR